MGKTVAGYTILPTVLGKGSYATVYRGEHKITGEAVAIKIMDRKELERDGVADFMDAEIGIMRTLNHPHIVKLKDVVSTRSTVHMIMELIDGKELFEQVGEAGSFDEQTARTMFQQLIQALDYLHAKNICHRDLKLENCMTESKTGVLKLIDFGFASYTNSYLRTPLGTLSYMAPETLSGMRYDGRAADIWASGVMLYTMVAGHYPFGSEIRDQVGVQQRIKRGEHVPFPSNFSEELQDLLRHIFVVEPSRRYSLSDIRRHPWFCPHTTTPTTTTTTATTAASLTLSPSSSSLSSDSDLSSRSTPTTTPSSSPSSNPTTSPKRSVSPCSLYTTTTTTTTTPTPTPTPSAPLHPHTTTPTRAVVPRSKDPAWVVTQTPTPTATPAAPTWTPTSDELSHRVRAGFLRRIGFVFCRRSAAARRLGATEL